MNQLPLPLLRLIDSHLELIDHFAFIAVNKRFNRLKIDYHSSWVEYKKKIYKFDVRFLKYLIRYHQFDNMRLIIEGNIECVRLFVSSVDIELNWGLFRACWRGDSEIMDLMIQHGATDWNKGLAGACCGGNIEVIQSMIHRGANDWNWGLFRACWRGDSEIMDLMIQKGADNLNYGLHNACESGNDEIVRLMIQYGATSCGWCGVNKHQF